MVAVIEEVEELVLKLYSHILLSLPTDILIFAPIPVNDIVGVALIDSENVAVIVTLEEGERILSPSELIRVTVGDTLSN